MKSLLVGVYRDGTGWGEAATSYIRAMHKSGLSVVPRPLKLNQAKAPVPSWLAALEAQSAEGCGTCIQMVLPHSLVYNGSFRRNISFHFSETDTFRYMGWQNHINTMDESWVACEQNRQAALESGVTIPIRTVPVPFDTEVLNHSYEPFALRDELGESFVFYVIGDVLNHRKNLIGLLRAFHSEFARDEPVELLIKAGLGEAEGVKRVVRGVKERLNLYPTPEHYKRELIVAERYSDTEMRRLHATCDCYVSPAFGEGWGLPAFEAMAFGKTPILTAFGGHLDFMTEQTGWLVPGRMEPVYAMHEGPFRGLYTGWEQWCSPDLLALRRAMREAYTNAGLREAKAIAGMSRAYDFDDQIIGNQIKELLNG